MVNHTYLCVGGPLDGKRYHETKHNNFRAFYQKPQFATFDPVMVPLEKFATIESIIYNMEIFKSTDGDIAIWVPEGQSLFETMKMLLEGYARDAEIQNKPEWER